MVLHKLMRWIRKGHSPRHEYTDTFALLFLTGMLGAAAYGIAPEHLSNTHAQYLSKVLQALARGRFEAIGFSYPPLPLFLLLPWPKPWATVLLGALGLAGVLYLVKEEIQKRKQRFLLALPVTFFLSPIPVELIVKDYAQVMALFLLLLAWKFYIRWLEKRLIFFGFASGLTLGVAIYVTPLALLFALIFAMGFGLFGKWPLATWATGGLILFFPVAIGIGAWAYLAWLFKGSGVFLYDGLQHPAPPFWVLLASTPVYWAVALIILARPSVQSFVYLSPLVALGLANQLGMGYTLAAGVGLLGFFALSGMPRRVPVWGKALFVAASLAQGVWLWRTVPLPQVTPEETIEMAIGRALTHATAQDILTDDSTAYRFVARAGTARIFLLPYDPGYSLALSAPSLFVRYVLVCRGPSALYSLYWESPPKDFYAEWSFSGCKFYRKRGAPPLYAEP